MEKTLSAEEKIRRAEEICKRRKIKENKISINTVNIGNSPEISLFKKTLIKLLFCLMLFFLIYVVKNTNYFFSKDVIDKINEILSYDIKLQEIYSSTSKYLENLAKDFMNFDHIDNAEESNESKNKEEINSNQEGGKTKNSNEENNEQAKENHNEINEEEEKNTNGNDQIKEENKETLENYLGVGSSDEIIDNSENNTMENDVKYIKDNFNLEKPVNGIVTSSFGPRISSNIISAIHEGIDIGANEGTKIKSAIQGTVTLVSDLGDYRKSFRNKK